MVHAIEAEYLLRENQRSGRVPRSPARGARDIEVRCASIALRRAERPNDCDTELQRIRRSKKWFTFSNARGSRKGTGCSDLNQREMDSPSVLVSRLILSISAFFLHIT